MASIDIPPQWSPPRIRSAQCLYASGYTGRIRIPFAQREIDASNEFIGWYGSVAIIDCIMEKLRIPGPAELRPGFLSVRIHGDILLGDDPFQFLSESGRIIPFNSYRAQVGVTGFHVVFAGYGGLWIDILCSGAGSITNISGGSSIHAILSQRGSNACVVIGGCIAGLGPAANSGFRLQEPGLGSRHQLYKIGFAKNAAPGYRCIIGEIGQCRIIPITSFGIDVDTVTYTDDLTHYCTIGGRHGVLGGTRISVSVEQRAERCAEADIPPGIVDGVQRVLDTADIDGKAVGIGSQQSQRMSKRRFAFSLCFGGIDINDAQGKPEFQGIGKLHPFAVISAIYLVETREGLGCIALSQRGQHGNSGIQIIEEGVISILL